MTAATIHLPQPPLNPTSLNINAWKCELAGDEDSEFLLKGIVNGFHLTNTADVISQTEVDNYSSATNRRALVEQQILEELR